jgi:hypothetical protein
VHLHARCLSGSGELLQCYVRSVGRVLAPWYWM